mmetsp:Transcript_64995/g.115677  ORF Transcript_64995/g.115677 Transcript_64995/m.115677 type:complete len:149 (-) Transcript_64995:819-1265(-)
MLPDCSGRSHSQDMGRGGGRTTPRAEIPFTVLVLQGQVVEHSTVQLFNCEMRDHTHTTVSKQSWPNMICAGKQMCSWMTSQCLALSGSRCQDAVLKRPFKTTGWVIQMKWKMHCRNGGIFIFTYLSCCSQNIHRRQHKLACLQLKEGP